MEKQETFWVHQASRSYRRDRPDRILERVWRAHPAWGYLQGRDLWISRECTEDELIAEGFLEIRPAGEPNSDRCPHCGMIMNLIPGSLAQKHLSDCGGGNEDWSKIENFIVDAKRMRDYEARLRDEALRKQREAEELEKQERLDRAREEFQARQQAKDRKKRLKEETKETLRKR
ncbi:MAG: hypothetical protein AB1473_08025 [Thermodesulfobacteriota bacterium]